MQVKNLNAELDSVCPSLTPQRIDAGDAVQAHAPVASPAAPTANLSSHPPLNAVAAAPDVAAGSQSGALPAPASGGAVAAHDDPAAASAAIVEESLAEAAALVHQLFDMQMQDKDAKATAGAQQGEPSKANTPSPGGRGGKGGKGSSKGGKPAKKDAANGKADAGKGAAGLQEDDERLMQVSTRLTTLFLAIQRCAALPCMCALSASRGCEGSDSGSFRT